MNLDASTVRKSDSVDDNTNDDNSALADEIVVQNTMAAQFEAWKAKQCVGKDLVEPPIGTFISIATSKQYVLIWPASR